MHNLETFPLDFLSQGRNDVKVEYALHRQNLDGDAKLTRIRRQLPFQEGDDGEVVASALQLPTKFKELMLGTGDFSSTNHL
jgi:hypothetical protein